jgi:hypothetical protein
MDRPSELEYRQNPKEHKDLEVQSLAIAELKRNCHNGGFFGHALKA